MNADHPALSAEPDELPSLTLVLPAGLDNDQALTRLVQAIAQARDGLAARFRQFQQLAVGYAARGDQVSQALCRGQALGGEHAAAAIDEAIVEIFDLWPQYEAQLQHQAADPQPVPDNARSAQRPGALSATSVSATANPLPASASTSEIAPDQSAAPPANSPRSGANSDCSEPAAR